MQKEYCCSEAKIIYGTVEVILFVVKPSRKRSVVDIEVLSKYAEEVIVSNNFKFT